MCAIGRPVDAGISARPSIIGPASALFRPQKSHSTGGGAGDELSSVVTLVTPNGNHEPKQARSYRPKPGRSRAGDQTGPFLNHTNGRDQKRPERGVSWPAGAGQMTSASDPGRPGSGPGRSQVR